MCKYSFQDILNSKELYFECPSWALYYVTLCYTISSGVRHCCVVTAKVLLSPITNSK